MKYLKAYWDECADGPAKSWGGSTWFFELDEDGYPIRQLELFDNGKLLAYDTSYLEDIFGGLSEVAIAMDDAPFTILTKDEFEQVWDLERAHNRGTQNSPP